MSSLKSLSPVAHHDSDKNELSVTVHTPEDYELGKKLPGARFIKREERWVIPASFFVGLRMAAIYEGRLGGTKNYDEYLGRGALAHADAYRARDAKRWDEIPVTAQQPTGKWMHQRRAFWFAYPLDAAMLAVTMGGGKTKVAIDLMQNWNARDVLIISPLAACEDAWIPQLEKYIVADRTYEVALSFSGSPGRRLGAAETVGVSDGEHRIVLINHETFWREPYRSFLMGKSWDLVIDDEIHREKSAGSKQSLALFQLSSRARRRLGLTGTPMPNSPLDVYGQYRFLDRGIYGTRKDEFDQEYAEWGGYHFNELLRYKNLEDLNRKFYSIGILIEDGEQGLPETVDIQRSVKLEPKTRKMYAEMEKHFITEVKKGTAVASNAGVKLLRLHQMACGIVATGEGKQIKTYRFGQEKLGELERILREEVGKDEPVVIFTRFALDTEAIARYFHACELSGRKNELREWKSGKGGQLLVAQIQAAKEGIDLTRAAIAIFYSTGINLGDYLQCRKRLHRPPQQRMVRFIHLLAAGTKDFSTMRALMKKKDVIESTLEEIIEEE